MPERDDTACKHLYKNIFVCFNIQELFEAKRRTYIRKAYILNEEVNKMKSQSARRVRDLMSWLELFHSGRSKRN